MQWTQVYDPLGHWWFSTLIAALPIIILFTLLAGLKVKPLRDVGDTTTALIPPEAAHGAPKIPAASFMPLLDLKVWWTTLRTSSDAGAVDSAGAVWVFATAVYNSYTKYPYVAASETGREPGTPCHSKIHC
jgi:hypothetical protein